MRFALYGVCEWKDFLAHDVNVPILLNRRGGNAIAVPSSTSNLNPGFPFKKS
jgi:hypothetical protein